MKELTRTINDFTDDDLNTILGMIPDSTLVARPDWVERVVKTAIRDGWIDMGTEQRWAAYNNLVFSR